MNLYATALNEIGRKDGVVDHVAKLLRQTKEAALISAMLSFFDGSMLSRARY